jgi:predicted AAA+ superfamily ATPase
VIVASSSSSSVFSDEHAWLTGRSVILPVDPLDFDEWLAFKNITLKKMDSHLLASYFEEFLSSGGMPEYIFVVDGKSRKANQYHKDGEDTRYLCQ